VNHGEKRTEWQIDIETTPPFKMVYLASNSHGSDSAKNGSNGHSGGDLGRTHGIGSNSRPASVNDNDSSAGENDDEEREGRIRVGKDYQANTPNFIPEECKNHFSPV
jgi:hypothetical protein